MRRSPTFLAIGFALASPLAVGQATATVATDLCPATANPCVVSSAKSVTPGSVLDFGTRALDVTSSGSLVVAGGMTILAGSLRVRQHGEIIGVFSNNTSPNIAVMTTGTIRIETGANGPGRIRVDDLANPGAIDLHAGGDVVINGELDSNASASDGAGGVITVVSDANLTATGAISARASTFGLGGSITLRGAGTVAVSSLVRADADDGGDIEIDSLNGDVTTSGQLNASGGGNFGDGGTVDLSGGRNLTVRGDLFLPGAGSAIEGGGTGGDVDLEATAGSISVIGIIDNHGAAPDGDGGEVVAFAGTDVSMTGDVIATGNGVDGCGGDVLVTTTRSFGLVSKLDLSGGFCGGDLEVRASTATLSATSDVVADAAFDGGVLVVAAEQITAAGRLQAGAESADPLSKGGLIRLAGCAIGIPANAIVKSTGNAAMNLLQASGQLTIGGEISARPNGKNRFEYRDPMKPPITLGSATIDPARECAPAPGCLTPILPPCATAAVCGNGVRESSESCDDANTTACDGCSSICQVEACGNRVIECGEECDDGPSNGGPGDPCDAECHVVQSANTIFAPSSHHGNGCMLEVAIRSAAVSGFPPSTIKCIDGDPACDADGVSDGGCDFQVSACLNVSDARIPGCKASAVSRVNLRRPSATDADDDLEQANADALVEALRTLGVTVRSRTTVLYSGTPQPAADHCTPAVRVRILHPIGGIGRELLSAGAENTLGRGVSNRTVLSCAANPAVCGNGTREIGEQCDDGNTAACDGCSETCREERCGDGIVQCGEQCDDGPSNGQPGAQCSATCTETPPPNRIPGGSGARDCLLEWSLATDQVAANPRGLPLTKQVCVDGSACDFDPAPGSCRVHLWACVAGDDPRLECVADAIGTLALGRPRPTDAGFLGAAATDLQDAFGRLALPAGPGEVCSPRIDLDIPAGRTKLAIKAEASSVGGARDRDRLRLLCAPAAP